MTTPSNTQNPEPLPVDPTPTENGGLVAAEAQERGVEIADPPPPVKGTLRRLLFWIVPANVGIFMLWGAIPGVLLIRQIHNADPAHDVANTTIITVIGAFAAMIAQPIAGVISDRTRSRFGPRAPWMLAGVTVGFFALLGLAAAGTSLVGIAIAWVVVQIAFNFAQGPLGAILPDRVPRSRRGSFAALSGLGLMVGALGGTIAGAAFLTAIPVGYIVFAIIALVVIVLFLLVNPDHSNVAVPKPAFSLRTFLHTFWVNPRKHPDFFWAFAGRLLLYVGYFAVSGYNQLILIHYIKVPESSLAANISVLALLGAAGTVPAILVSGPISDKLGRRKPFVFISSILIALALIIPIVSPTISGMMIESVILGFGFGFFQSVDTALMSEVLPSAEDFGKDIGVINIAATLPQVLGPGIAGVVVLATGGYVGLFITAILLAILGSFAVWPIKAVR